MGIKEKLPLLNSDNKGVRVTGYVVYAFIVLMLIGAILPSPETKDIDVQPATSSGSVKESDTKDDIAWNTWANISISSIKVSLDDALNIADSGDSYATYEALGKVREHVDAAKKISRQYSVSSKYKSAKDDFESYLYGVDSGCENLQKWLDAKSLGEKSNALKDSKSSFAYAVENYNKFQSSRIT